MRRRWSVIILASAVLVGLIVAYLTVPVVGSIDNETLAASVLPHTTSSGGYEASCWDGVSSEVKRCSFMDADYEAGLDYRTVDYRVVLDGRCWRGTRTRAPGWDPPTPINDCVVMADKLRIFGRIVKAALG